MTITMCSYSAATDRQRVIDFRRACTTLENIRDYPTVVDLYKLLDTSTSHEVERISLWEDENGNLAAYAIVTLQYCNCYFHIHPRFLNHDIEQRIFDWAAQQIRETARCTAIDTPCRDTDIERVALLERQGFARQQVQTLYMARPLLETIPPASFPDTCIASR